MGFDDIKIHNGKQYSGMRIGTSHTTSFVEVPLANKKGYAKISPEDESLISTYKWHLSASGYAITDIGTKPNRKVILMHRLILGIKGRAQTDHINHDKLDNRRSNIRVANASQNASNTPGLVNKRKSRYKGVYQKRAGWAVHITKNKKTIHLGQFNIDEEELAARAYDSAALYLFGEFAAPNFPDSVPIDPDTLPRRQRRRGRGYEASFAKSKGKWVARIRDRGYRKHIGYFASKEEAIVAAESAIKAYRSMMGGVT